MTTEYIPPRCGPGTSPAAASSPASIARSPARHTTRQLPVGKHPFQLYSLATPNGQKVSILFEELLERGHRDAEYDAWPIRIGDGDQFGSGFVAVNPNARSRRWSTAAAPSRSACSNPARSCFTSPRSSANSCRPRARQRAETLSWLFWQMGSAPFLGGGFGHFFAYAPVKIEYAINRYAMEAKRQLDVLDRRLAESEYVAGPDYSIADIAIWPWYGSSRLAAPTKAPTFSSPRTDMKM